MIFYSLSQLKSFNATIIASVVFVFTVFLLKVIFSYNCCNIVLKNIQLFIFSLLGGFIYLLSTNLFCFGEYNIFLLTTYLIVFIVTTKLLKNLLDFFSLKVYYIYIKIFKWERKQFARKFGSIKD